MFSHQARWQIADESWGKAVYRCCDSRNNPRAARTRALAEFKRVIIRVLVGRTDSLPPVVISKAGAPSG